MKSRSVLALFQVSILALLGGIGILFNWACIGGGGGSFGHGSDYSTHGTGLRDEKLPGQSGKVARYHDFNLFNGSLQSKDLSYVRTRINNLVFGVLAPTAPGAIQAGSLITTTHSHSLSMQYFASSRWKSIWIDLAPDAARAAQLTELYPPPAGQQWQALVPANSDWISQVPTSTLTFKSSFGTLAYVLDFHGGDECNHCQVELVNCTRIPLPDFFQPVTNLTGAPGLYCNPPVVSFITISTVNFPNISYAPGPVVAAFGLWGSANYTATKTSTISIPYNLMHTSAQAQRFNLAPAHSERGWSYQWMAAGVPATQVDALPMPTNTSGKNTEVRLVSNSLPAGCVDLVDTVTITATMVTTPTVIATGRTQVELLPDPARCKLVDLGVEQASSATTITPGGWVTFTLAASNFMTATASATITETITPAAALASVIPPAACMQPSATQVTCHNISLGAVGTANLTTRVQAAASYNGLLTSRAQIQPLNGVDGRQYDNTSLPLDVTVGSGTTRMQVYIPVVLKR